MKTLKLNPEIFAAANDKTIINCALLGMSGTVAVPAFMLMSCFVGIQFACAPLAPRVVSRYVLPVVQKLNGRKYTGRALPRYNIWFLFDTNDILQLMIDIKKIVGFGAMIDDAKILE